MQAGPKARKVVASFLRKRTPPEHVTEVQRPRQSGERARGSLAGSLALLQTGHACLGNTCPSWASVSPLNNGSRVFQKRTFCGVSRKSVHKAAFADPPRPPTPGLWLGSFLALTDPFHQPSQCPLRTRPIRVLKAQGAVGLSPFPREVLAWLGGQTHSRQHAEHTGLWEPGGGAQKGYPGGSGSEGPRAA